MQTAAISQDKQKQDSHTKYMWFRICDAKIK
jgi:hypothetical protein